MSDQPMPAIYTPEPAKPVKEKLYCKKPDCDFETESPSGLTRHNTIKHGGTPGRKKKKKATPEMKTLPQLPTNRWAFKELDTDGNGRVLMKAPDGSWWVATKLDI